MDLFLYSKSPDQSYACTSLTDLQALIATLNDVNGPDYALVSRLTGKLPALTQGDSGEPLVITSYDDASTVSAWVTDASTVLAAGLGDPDPAGGDAYASTTSFTIVGNTRVGTLALNTTDLQDALGLLLTGRRTAGQFTLQLRKSAAGVTETMARLPVEVAATVLSSSPVTQAGTTYVTPTEVAAGYLQNRSGITSLTGGGATALDGIVTLGSTAAPVGCIVILSYGLVTQFWQLLAGTDAENVAATPAVVRPDDYNAVTNAVVWKQIG